MKITKEIDCTFIKLMKVERALFHLYKKLADTDNKKRYLEYLSTTLEVENKILNSTDFTWENSKQLFNRYLCLLSEQEWSKEEVHSLAERLNNFLEAKLFSKPFKSITYNKEAAKEENNLIISNTASRDYIVNLLFLLGNEIQKEEDITTKKVLEPPFYQLCFENKAFEQALTKPLAKPAINGRKRCIDFGHEKEIVDEVYQELSYRIISLVLDHLFQYPDAALKESNYKRASQKVSLLNLKGAAYLLTEKELANIYQENYNAITKETPLLQQYYRLTTNNILSTLKSSYEEVKNYQKAKK